MIVECQSCQKRFNVPSDKVTDKGLKVKCSHCKHVFRITPADDIEAKAAKPEEIDLLDIDLSAPKPEVHEAKTSVYQISPEMQQKLIQKTQRQAEEDDLELIDDMDLLEVSDDDLQADAGLLDLEPPPVNQVSQVEEQDEGQALFQPETEQIDLDTSGLSNDQLQADQQLFDLAPADLSADEAGGQDDENVDMSKTAVMSASLLEQVKQMNDEPELSESAFSEDLPKTQIADIDPRMFDEQYRDDKPQAGGSAGKIPSQSSSELELDTSYTPYAQDHAPATTKSAASSKTDSSSKTTAVNDRPTIAMQTAKKPSVTMLLVRGVLFALLLGGVTIGSFFGRDLDFTKIQNISFEQLKNYALHGVVPARRTNIAGVELKSLQGQTYQLPSGKSAYVITGSLQLAGKQKNKNIAIEVALQNKKGDVLLRRTAELGKGIDPEQMIASAKLAPKRLSRKWSKIPRVDLPKQQFMTYFIPAEISTHLDRIRSGDLKLSVRLKGI